MTFDDTLFDAMHELSSSDSEEDVLEYLEAVATRQQEVIESVVEATMISSTMNSADATPLLQSSLQRLLKLARATSGAATLIQPDGTCLRCMARSPHDSADVANTVQVMPGPPDAANAVATLLANQAKRAASATSEAPSFSASLQPITLPPGRGCTVQYCHAVQALLRAAPELDSLQLPWAARDLVLVPLLHPRSGTCIGWVELAFEVPEQGQGSEPGADAQGAGASMAGWEMEARAEGMAGIPGLDMEPDAVATYSLVCTALAACIAGSQQQAAAEAQASELSSTVRELQASDAYEQLASLHQATLAQLDALLATSAIASAAQLAAGRQDGQPAVGQPVHTSGHLDRRTSLDTAWSDMQDTMVGMLAACCQVDRASVSLSVWLPEYDRDADPAAGALPHSWKTLQGGEWVHSAPNEAGGSSEACPEHQLFSAAAHRAAQAASAADLHAADGLPRMSWGPFNSELQQAALASTSQAALATTRAATTSAGSLALQAGVVVADQPIAAVLVSASAEMSWDLQAPVWPGINAVLVHAAQAFKACEHVWQHANARASADTRLQRSVAQQEAFCMQLLAPGAGPDAELRELPHHRARGQAQSELSSGGDDALLPTVRAAWGKIMGEVVAQHWAQAPWVTSVRMAGAPHLPVQLAHALLACNDDVQSMYQQDQMQPGSGDGEWEPCVRALQQHAALSPSGTVCAWWAPFTNEWRTTQRVCPSEVQDALRAALPAAPARCPPRGALLLSVAWAATPTAQHTCVLLQACTIAADAWQRGLQSLPGAPGLARQDLLASSALRAQAACLLTFAQWALGRCQMHQDAGTAQLHVQLPSSLHYLASLANDWREFQPAAHHVMQVDAEEPLAEFDLAGWWSGTLARVAASTLPGLAAVSVLLPAGSREGMLHCAAVAGCATGVPGGQLLDLDLHDPSCWLHQVQLASTPAASPQLSIGSGSSMAMDVVGTGVPAIPRDVVVLAREHPAAAAWTRAMRTSSPQAVLAGARSGTSEWALLSVAVPLPDALPADLEPLSGALLQLLVLPDSAEPWLGGRSDMALAAVAHQVAGAACTSWTCACAGLRASQDFNAAAQAAATRMLQDWQARETAQREQELADAQDAAQRATQRLAQVEARAAQATAELSQLRLQVTSAESAQAASEQAEADARRVAELQAADLRCALDASSAAQRMLQAASVAVQSHAPASLHDWRVLHQAEPLLKPAVLASLAQCIARASTEFKAALQAHTLAVYTTTAPLPRDHVGGGMTAADILEVGPPTITPLAVCIGGQLDVTPLDAAPVNHNAEHGAKPFRPATVLARAARAAAAGWLPHVRVDVLDPEAGALLLSTDADSAGSMMLRALGPLKRALLYGQALDVDEKSSQAARCRSLIIPLTAAGDHEDALVTVGAVEIGWADLPEFAVPAASTAGLPEAVALTQNRGGSAASSDATHQYAALAARSLQSLLLAHLRELQCSAAMAAGPAAASKLRSASSISFGEL